MKKMQIDGQFPYVCHVIVDGKSIKVHCNVEITFKGFDMGQEAVESVIFGFPPMCGFISAQPFDTENSPVGSILRKNASGETVIISIYIDHQITVVSQNSPQGYQNEFHLSTNEIENGDDIYFAMIPTLAIFEL